MYSLKLHYNQYAHSNLNQVLALYPSYVYNFVIYEVFASMFTSY